MWEVIEKQGLYFLHVNHSIFAINKGITSLIIISFVNNLNIFAFYKNRITSRIKSELTTTIEMIDIDPLIVYVRLKVTSDQKKRIIKLF